MTYTKHYSAATLREIATKWQKQGDEENGKTFENGWTRRELYAAEQRQAECYRKRDMCLEAARVIDNC